jgi:hypothetical protein
MADENIDLNPISLGGEIKKKKPRPIPVAPTEENLLITAYSKHSAKRRDEHIYSISIFP